MQRMQALKLEKQHIVAAVEQARRKRDHLSTLSTAARRPTPVPLRQEEEYLTNTLQRQLAVLAREKARARRNLVSRGTRPRSLPLKRARALVRRAA